MKVLFLAMEFPPVNTTGNYRSLKFVKYLNAFGIEPIVVTFDENEASKFFNTKIDKSLLLEIPDSTTIYRIHCEPAEKYYKTKFRSFLTIYFSIKDNLAGRWRKYVMGKMVEIVAKHKPSVIFTSLPPFSSGMLGVEISKKYNLPLVVDMRDFYALWGNTPFASKLHYWLTLREEAKIFERAKKIIGVTPQLISQFKKYHPSIPTDKFECISNGFDRPTERISNFSFLGGQRKIKIGYVGSFYYNPRVNYDKLKPWWKKGHRMLQYSPMEEDWLYRSPYFFLKTIASLFRQRPSLRQIIEIEFVGKKPEWLNGMVDDFGLGEQTTFHGFLPQREVLLLQEKFDLILATSEKVIGEEHYCLPSKLFDYVGLNKPIVGFVTDGIQKEFLIKSGLGIICDPDDEESACSKLLELVTYGMEFYPDNRYLESFQRKNLTEQLSRVFKSLAEGNLNLDGKLFIH